MIVPSGLPIQIKTKVAWEAIDQVRIVPRRDFYVVEVVYQKAEQQAPVDPKLVAALDPGVNTLRLSPPTNPDLSRVWSVGSRSKASISTTTNNENISRSTLPNSS